MYIYIFHILIHWWRLRLLPCLGYHECVHVWVTQLCLTVCDPMDCSPPGSSVHGILQARVLEWIATSFSRGSSWSKDQTQVSCIAGGFFTIWATGKTNSATINIRIHLCFRLILFSWFWALNLAEGHWFIGCMHTFIFPWLRTWLPSWLLFQPLDSMQWRISLRVVSGWTNLRSKWLCGWPLIGPNLMGKACRYSTISIRVGFGEGSLEEVSVERR